MADLTEEQLEALSPLDRAFLDAGTHVVDPVHGVVPRLPRGAEGGAALYREIEEIETAQLQKEIDAANSAQEPAPAPTPTQTPAPKPASTVTTPATQQTPAQ